MSPQKIAGAVRRELPLLRTDTSVRDALRVVLDAGVPALPVVDDAGRLRGIFGDREFMTALFPRYLAQLGSAGFIPRSLDAALEKRATCTAEPVGKHMNCDHVKIGEGFSDTEVAEIFLHHRVLIVPIVDDGVVTGVVTRPDFFRALAERALARA